MYVTKIDTKVPKVQNKGMELLVYEARRWNLSIRIREVRYGIY